MRNGVKLFAAGVAELLERPNRYYGQFCEDAVLQALFMDRLRDKAPGFYVDVGAFSPRKFSNTYWFYRRGWRGINIDATPGSMRLFKLLRRGDINLEVAVALNKGQATFHVMGLRSVFNTLSPVQASSIETHFHLPAKRITVPTEPLASILERYNCGTIDFLTVDVEGHDIQVLQSNNWELFRPSIILVEQHGVTPDSISSSEVFRYLRRKGYVPCAQTGPTVFYRLSH